MRCFAALFALKENSEEVSMKKLILLVLMMFVSTFTGCGGSDEKYGIEITIPAGSADEFVFSKGEYISTKDTVTIWSGSGLGDTEVVLKPVSVEEENVYEPTYLTHGMPVEFEVEKQMCFKIGVNMQNESAADKVVTVEVEGAEEVRSIKD